MMCEIEGYNEALPTPIELFGVECLDGWKDLYIPLFKYVEEYNKDKSEEEKIHVTQVKEKWGQLEFYTDYYTEELLEMIKRAHYESKKICEKCGSRSDIGMVISGWFHTTCLECLLKELKPSKKMPKLPRKLKKAYKLKRAWASKKKIKYGHTSIWVRNNDNMKYRVYPNGYMEIVKGDKRE